MVRQAAHETNSNVFSSRPVGLQVLFAGSKDQVRQVVEAAESYREQLAERGVLLVPLPLFGDSIGSPTDLPPLAQEDLK